jgi:hypothetical protein
MKKELTTFQKQSFKIHRPIGFYADTANIVFTMIIEMRNLVTAAETSDTILLHKHIGLCAQAIANYATLNSLKLENCIIEDYQQMMINTDSVELEFFLEKIRDDLSFVNDMSALDKTEFIQKSWIAIFPEEYHNAFLKIDRILKQSIDDNKIKYPEKYTN